MAAYGFVAGLPLPLSGFTLRLWLSEGGVSLAVIGLTANIALAYSLKFLWAPVLDNARPPGPLRRLGRRRGWLAAIQPALAAAAALLALSDPAHLPFLSLALAALGIVQLPSRLTESLIALSIVVVGLHNLWRLRRAGGERGGFDPRILFAFGFGLVHGFGFASVLREIGLPPRALGISLFSFNLGVEIGQAVLVVIVASLLSLLRSRSPIRARQVVTVASVVVTLAGAYWFVERIW